MGAAVFWAFVVFVAVLTAGLILLVRIPMEPEDEWMEDDRWKALDMSPLRRKGDSDGERKG